MNRHLDEYLCKKYPEIFADRSKSMRETCMCWGFCHGDGWFFLIDALCTAIQGHVENPPYVLQKNFRARAFAAWNWIARKLHLPYKWFIHADIYEPGPKLQVVATQVKEKFGGLRFYHSGGDDEIRGMVRLAEVLSYRICEECGVMNELVTQNDGGWIRTTCPCCVEPHLKQNHLENRRTEMVELWKKVQEDRNNDRKKQAVQQDSSCEK